jgi:hypothetical protein
MNENIGLVLELRAGLEERGAEACSENVGTKI